MTLGELYGNAPNPHNSQGQPEPAVQTESLQEIKTDSTVYPEPEVHTEVLEEQIITKFTFDESADGFDPFAAGSFPAQVIGTPPTRQKEHEKEDKQKLIPLAPRDSDHAKRFFGTGWRNAQFLVHSSSGPLLLPQDWYYKNTGVTVRARVMGEPVYRRLVLEIAYRKSDDPSKTAVAYLQFDNHAHVTEYEVKDKVVAEDPPQSEPRA